MGKRVNLAALAIDDEVAPARRPRGETVAGIASQESAPSVPIHTVTLNPLNKRPSGDDDQIAEMAETIRVHGVIQPLVVCSATAYLAEFPDQRDAVVPADWVVLIGNRRLRAARLAGIQDVTILVNDERAVSMYEVMLVENGQRRELPPIREAEAMSEVLAKSSVSQRELARRIGKSAMYVTQRLALLKLIPELKLAFEAGDLTIERAREFGELPVPLQLTIVAAGKPYRRPVNAGETSSGAALRSIRVSTPAVAAESIRKKFSQAELAELIQLLSEHLAASQASTSTS